MTTRIDEIRHNVYIGRHSTGNPYWPFAGTRAIELDSISSHCYDQDGNPLPGTWRGMYDLASGGLPGKAIRIG